MSFIELGTPEMTADQMKQAEKIVNEKIRAAVPVYPTLFEAKDDAGLASVSVKFHGNYLAGQFVIRLHMRVKIIIEKISICCFLPSCKVRTRGLPDDHVGSVRVVTIEGIETNMCCGTHVSNLSHLQVTAPNVIYIYPILLHLLWS